MNPLKGLFDCLEDIKAWMALHFLNLNEQKTEVIVFGACDHLDLGHLEIYKKSSATNLGVIFDSNLTNR